MLVWAGFLTTAQLAKAAGYPSLRRAQRRLRVWLDRGFTRVELQSGALHRPSLHLPTARAREHLVEEGGIDANYVVPRAPRAQKRHHALLIRDVFAELAAAETRREMVLEDFRFDSDLCRAEPFRSAGLVPDAVATIEAGERVATIAVECDAGTETTTTLRKKFERWRVLADSWRPPNLALLAVAEREGRRKTLERLMNEASLGAFSRAGLVTDLPAFVQGLGTPHDHAARVRRAERRTSIVQRIESIGSQQRQAEAFRELSQESTPSIAERGGVVVVRDR